MSPFEALLKDCEDVLRSGKGDLPERLSRLQGREVSRQYLVRFANVCRRAGLLPQGLRLLAPAIRRDRKTLLGGEATPEEVVEYAALLQRSGAVDEAIRLLQTVNMETVPTAYLFRAFCHFMRWEYAAAVPLLEAYLRRDLEPYARATAEVNLAAALNGAQHFDRALAVLDDCLETCRRNGYVRLTGNCYELKSQVLIQQGRWAEAQTNVESARLLLLEDKTLDAFFVEKSLTIMEALRSRSTEPLLGLQKRAVEKQAWETAREADFVRLQLTSEEPVLERLYFGTPFPAYHERVLRRIGRLPSKSRHSVGEGPVSYDVFTGEGQGGSLLKIGSAAHRLLSILLRDFYRPWTMGALFSELFPGQLYDISSSPERVHQAMYRLRRWLREAAIPAAIGEANGLYKFVVTGPFEFRVARPTIKIDAQTSHLAKLGRGSRAAEWLSAADIATILGLEPTSNWRFLAWATQNGHLAKFGAGLRTTYRLESVADFTGQPRLLSGQ